MRICDGSVFRAAPIDETNRAALASPKDEEGFVFQTVDGVDDEIVVVEVVIVSSLFRIDVADGGDVGIGVYGEEALAHGIHLDLPERRARTHYLSVQVGWAYDVGVDYGEILDPAPYEALGAPRPYAAHAEYYHLRALDPCHGIGAEQEPRPT